jgi:hypothetical protein
MAIRKVAPSHSENTLAEVWPLWWEQKQQEVGRPCRTVGTLGASIQFYSFGYIDDQYLHRIAPTAKRRRCQQCTTSAVCVMPIRAIPTIATKEPARATAFNLIRHSSC